MKMPRISRRQAITMGLSGLGLTGLVLSQLKGNRWVMVPPRDEDDKKVKPQTVRDLYEHSIKLHTKLDLEDEVWSAGAKKFTKEIYASGTGVVLRGDDNETYVLTVEHLTRAYRKKQQNSRILKAETKINGMIIKVIRENKKADLSLGKLLGSMDLNPFKGKIPKYVGEGNYFITAGYPGDIKDLILGKVKDVEPFIPILSVDDDHILLNKEIKPGNSGGGVYIFENGEPLLVGVMQISNGAISSLPNLRKLLKGTPVEHYLE